LKALAQRLKLRDFLPLQFLPNLLKLLNRFGGIQSLATPQAYFGAHMEHGGVPATSKQFLDFFLYQLTTANRTFLERSHFVFLVRQFTHRCGSGRYTVINTAHCVSGLYAHTL
jgi:hypothetical protein